MKTRMKTNIKNIFKNATVIAILTVLLPHTSPTAKAAFSVANSNERIGSVNYQAKPGTTIEDFLVITNLDSQPVTVKNYGADTVKNANGNFAITNEKEEQKDIGKWLKFDEKEIKLAPNEKKKVYYKINVPKNITPGIYAGGIATEGLAEKAVDGGTGFSVVSRFATRVYVQIPGEVITDLEWSNFSYETIGGKTHRFHLDFKNKGNSHSIAESKIQIFGFPDGDNEDEDSEQKPQAKNTIVLSESTMLGNDEVSLTPQWKKSPWFGFYKAKATVTFWDYDPSKGEKVKPNTLTKEISFFVIRPEIIYILILILLVTSGIIVHKKLKMAKVKKTTVDYTVAEHETLQSIAKDYRISWKQLAYLNDMKPPYTIEAGQNIKVPKDVKGKPVQAKPTVSPQAPTPPTQTPSNDPNKPLN